MPVRSSWEAVVKSSSKIIHRTKTGEVKSFEFSDVDRIDGNYRSDPASPEQPGPITAAELEQIQEQARQEAYEEGRKQGFEFGHQQALEEFRSQFAEQAEQINSIIEAFQQPFLDLDDQVEQEIVELVISMVRQLIRREVKMDPNHVIGVVREALSILPVASRNVSLVLNPEDAELVRNAFSLDEKEQGWEIVEDPVLDRGGCRVLAEQSQVDATLESRLDALIAPLLSDERQKSDSGDES